MQDQQSNSSTPNLDAQDVPIGKIIKERVEAVGISKAELARRLNMSPANVHKIFKRNTVDVKLLCRLSYMLHYDFLALFRVEIVTYIRPGRSFTADAHSPDDKTSQTRSLDRRIELIAGMLEDLKREDPRHPAAEN